MKIVQELGYLKILQTIYDINCEELRSIENIIMRTSSVIYPKGEPSYVSPQEELLKDRDEYREKVERNKKRLKEEKDRLFEIVCQLSNDEYIKIIYMRYFEYKTWGEIAKKLGYSIKQIMRKHEKAIDELIKLSENVRKCPSDK